MPDVIEPTQLWIGRDDERLGPHTLDRFRTLHRDGRLRHGDLVWWDGLDEWIALDAALTRLGLDTSIPPMPDGPPPIPPGVGVASTAGAATPLPTRNHGRTPIRRNDGAPTSIWLGFAGLVLVAVLAAGGFTFLTAPGSWSFGRASREVQEALTGAAMYKVAYAEYVLSNDKPPNTLEDIGVVSAPYGALQGARIDAGTILLHTSVGQLALQPYRNANYSIIFRCGYDEAPQGMDALGRVDSAQATTVARGDLPDSCR